MPAVGDDETGIVCWVTPEGNIICNDVFESAECAPPALLVAASDKEPVSSATDTAPAAVRTQLPLPAGEWGPNKTELACRILEVLAASKMPDETIPRRSGEIVDATGRLLAPVPPSIMLFNYSTQPADVLGAYYLNRGELVKMQQIFKIFEHPKQP